MEPEKNSLLKASEDEATESNKENEYENFLDPPKTPEKKHPVKHIANIATPFKITKSQRNEIRDKENMAQAVLLARFQETCGMEEDQEWFRQTRPGRKRKPFQLIKDRASPITKSPLPICPVENYFGLHFKEKAVLYDSSESIVYQVREKTPTEKREKQGDACPYCKPSECVPKKAEKIVKILKKQWSSPKEKKDKIKEAKFLHRLRKCRYIAQLLRAWEEKAVLYLEMPLYNEGTLRDFMKKIRGQHSTLKTKVSLMHQMIKGLKAIHRAKIIHMDIKPENIYLHRDTHGSLSARIGDFGISRSSDDAGEIEFDGDRLYMAPEVLQNNCSGLSDIYSMGLVFIELLFNVGAPLKTIPWLEKSQKEKEDMVRRSGISPHVYTLVKQMISLDPADRPAIPTIIQILKHKPPFGPGTGIIHQSC
ncbi:hypothetical protein NEDG_01899 [Nematocida displodere]|uniref:Protein kinase domain-containing protein n=1 Tax=Nematocida displodere TaxID=1805483 RepID=A0A177EGN2_9MICR|nr:hypothetical protein NEDG_01899 [Nematocida displodere]